MIDRKVFFLLGFIIFLSMTGYGIVLPTLPFVADRIGLSSFEMGTLITGWAIAQLAVAPLWGRLADTWGRKPVLLFGLFGFALAFSLLIFANSYWQLLSARIVGAALSSGTLPAVVAMVSDLTDVKHRNVAIAKMGALSGLGFLCGPAVGGVFAPFGVNVPFIVAGSLAFLSLPLAAKFIDEPTERTANIRQRERQSLFQSFSILFQKGYWQLFVITFGVSMAASSFFGLLGYFMIARFDAAPIAVSAAFSAQAGVSVIVQFFLLEKLYEIFSEETLARAGLVFITCGFSLIAFAPHEAIVILGALFTGFGQACVNPTVLSLLSKRERYGQGLTVGIHQSMNSLGRVVGPLFGGVFFALFISGPFLSSAAVTLLLFIMIIFTSMDDEHPRVRKEKSV